MVQTHAAVQRTLPNGVRARVVYDRSQLVGDALGNVTRAILIGAGLVVLVLFVVLGNMRLVLLVTLTLPLSLALAGLILRPAGIGIADRQRRDSQSPRR